MKNEMSLDGYGVENLPWTEQRGISGGNPVIIGILAAMGGVILNEVTSDWNNFKRGLSGGTPIK